MNAHFARIIPLLVLAAGLSAVPAAAQTIKVRWNSPSDLTPGRAAKVLYLQADGQAVSPIELFEAEKYLRTDGAASQAGAVVVDAFTRLLANRLVESPDVRFRALPPVLHWLETSFTTTSVRLRGETVQVAVLNTTPNLAATVVQHSTILQEWKLCGADPCFTASPPQRATTMHELTVPLVTIAPAVARSSELLLATGLEGAVFSQTFPASDESRYLGTACEALPSQTLFPWDRTKGARMVARHSASSTENGRTNRLLCAFFALPGGAPATLKFTRNGAVAGAPSFSAARSAVKNNPLVFSVYE